MRLFAAPALLAVLVLQPAAAADSLSGLHFLVGNWNCTYHAGKNRVDYKATYVYDLGNGWLRENDSWTGGGSDLGMITYDTKHHAWTAIVLEHERTYVIFRGSGSNPNHIVYRSVYPQGNFTDVFERNSQTRYTLNFTATAAGRQTKSNDVCTKA